VKDEALTTGQEHFPVRISNPQIQSNRPAPVRIQVRANLNADIDNGIPLGILIRADEKFPLESPDIIHSGQIEVAIAVYIVIECPDMMPPCRTHDCVRADADVPKARGRRGVTRPDDGSGKYGTRYGIAYGLLLVQEVLSGDVHNRAGVAHPLPLNSIYRTDHTFFWPLDIDDPSLGPPCGSSECNNKPDKAVQVVAHRWLRDVPVIAVFLARQAGIFPERRLDPLKPIKGFGANMKPRLRVRRNA